MCAVVTVSFWCLLLLCVCFDQIQGQLGALRGKLDRSLGLVDNPNPDDFRAVSTREVAAMEARLRSEMSRAAGDAAAAVAADSQARR